MTEQELMELWGDGTQFGMTELGAGVMTGALNNAFREVSVKFALISTCKAYNKGYSDGYREGVESVRSGVLGDYQ